MDSISSIMILAADIIKSQQNEIEELHEFIERTMDELNEWKSDCRAAVSEIWYLRNKLKGIKNG